MIQTSNNNVKIEKHSPEKFVYEKKKKKLSQCTMSVHCIESLRDFMFSSFNSAIFCHTNQYSIEFLSTSDSIFINFSHKIQANSKTPTFSMQNVKFLFSWGIAWLIFNGQFTECRIFDNIPLKPFFNDFLSGIFKDLSMESDIIIIFESLT